MIASEQIWLVERLDGAKRSRIRSDSPQGGGTAWIIDDAGDESVCMVRVYTGCSDGVAPVPGEARPK